MKKILTNLGVSLLVSLAFSCLTNATTQVIVGPYFTELSVEGSGDAVATSEDRGGGAYTQAIVSAFSDGGTSHSWAYAEAESILHVNGGVFDSDVTVTINYALEIFGRKSLDNSIASANSIIDITDFNDPNTIIWGSELDLHLTGSILLEEQGDIFTVLTDTLTLKSGHSYYIALESFAEANAFVGDGVSEPGWARAEAEADPTFSIAGENLQGYSLDHVVINGSSTQSVPEPASLLLLGIANLSLAFRRPRR